MIFKVFSISNKQISVEVEPNSPIYEIRQTISKLLKIDFKTLRLFYCGALLDDSKQISEYEFDDKNKVIYFLQNINITVAQPVELEKVESPPSEKLVTPISKTENKRIRESPLPMIGKDVTFNDPDDFKDKVESLQSAISCSAGDAENALRSANYNANLAAQFILSGSLIDGYPTANVFDDSDKSEYQKMLSMFRSSELEAIRKLEKLGFDSILVMQVFQACDKDEKKALEVLMSMK